MSCRDRSSLRTSIWKLHYSATSCGLTFLLVSTGFLYKVSGNELGICDFWPGSVYHSEACYQVYEETETWQDSKFACERAVPGGKLAEPKNKATLAFLFDIMMASTIDDVVDGGKIDSNRDTWIGARKVSAYGKFRYASTNQQIWSIPSFLQHPDLSDTLNDPSTSFEGCLSLVVVNSLVTFDSCGVKLRRVCQIDVDKLCSADNRYYDGHCYHFKSDSNRLAFGSYDEAKAKCQASNNAQLVELHHESVSYFLQNYMTELLWDTTVNYDNNDENKIIDVSEEHDVFRGIGEDLCFLVKGFGEGYVDLHSALDGSGDHETCEMHLYLNTVRKEDQITFGLEVCRHCGNSAPDCEGDEQLSQHVPGNTWSYYCIKQGTASHSKTLVLTYSGNDGKKYQQTMDVQMDDFDLDLTFVSVSSDYATYQWKFSSYSTTSIYVGAVEAEETWESGIPIRSYFNVPKLPQSQGHDRLIFQSYPMAFLPSDGANDQTPILCRKKWGVYYHFGVVPLGVAMSSTLYLTQRVKEGSVLFNYAPNILAGDMIFTVIKKISQTTKIMLYNYFFDGDDMSTGLVFVLRTFKSTVVELFSKDTSYAFSTLVLPQTSVSEQYVLCGLDTLYGQIHIVNHQEWNDISIQPPKLRRIIFMRGGIKYRPYHMQIDDVAPFQNISIDFDGDVSGTTISGTKSISVFIATSQEPDITFDQMLGASWTSEGYSPFNFVWQASTLVKSKYKVVAFEDDTTIKNTVENTSYILPSHGDTILISPTESVQTRLTSEAPFYASFVFADRQMSCATTLVAQRYWRKEYLLSLESDHYLAVGSGSQTGVAIVVIVKPDAEPSFEFNGNSIDFSCVEVADSRYKHCYTDDIATGHYVIRSTTQGLSFGAYLIGAEWGKRCYVRFVDIDQTTSKSNRYITPPFVEPEECPELPTPSHPYVNVTITPEVEEEIRENVRKELEIDVHATSNFVRKKISVPDDRTSSQTVGIGGVVIISMVTVLLIIPDGITVWFWFVKKITQS